MDEAASPPSGRSAGRGIRPGIGRGIVGIVGVVVAAVVAALWLVGAVRTSPEAEHGGADSPGELGEQLLTSLVARDRSLADSLLLLVASAERAVLAPGDVPAREVDELIRLVGLDELAEVVDLLGPALTGTSVRVSAGWSSEVMTVLVTADDGLGSPVTARLSAVEHDGRWHISIGHTVVDLLLAAIEPVPEVPVAGLVPAAPAHRTMPSSGCWARSTDSISVACSRSRIRVVR